MKHALGIFLCILFLLISPCSAEEPETGIRFTCDSFSIDLPANVTVLDEDVRSAYCAAVANDFPDAAQCILLAVQEEVLPVISVCCANTGLSPIESARQSARIVLGSDSAANEVLYGENTFGYFACKIDGIVCHNYFFGTPESTFCACVTGLDNNQLEALMSSIQIRSIGNETMD